MRVYILFEGHKNNYGQVLSEMVIDVYDCKGKAEADKYKLEKTHPYTDYWVKEWSVK